MGGAGQTQRGGGGLYARRSALAARTPFRASSARTWKQACSRWTISSPRTIAYGRLQLLAGIVDKDFAAAVGRDLGLIHARSAADPDVPAAFANDDTFEAIRIEPYLRATGRAHPALATRFDALARTTLMTKRALVHGDVSPKNILQGPDGPVFLDAECASFGDPAFDLAFCLNHLLLKGAREGVDQGALQRRLFSAC